MQSPIKHSVKQQGFTLIELIIVMVITAIIAVGSTQFIVNAVQGLNDVSRRGALASSLTTSIEKIERQLQASLVNSIRIKRGKSGQCVEMLPIQASAFYLKAPLGRSASTLQVISLDKDVVGMRAYIAEHKRQDLYAQLGSVEGAQSSAITGMRKSDQPSIIELTLGKSHRFATGSPQQLVHFVRYPVSYCIEGDKLFRYSRYPLSKRQRLPATLPAKEPYKVLVNQGLLMASSFDFQPESRYFQLLLSAGTAQEQLTINQLIKLSYE